MLWWKAKLRGKRLGGRNLLVQRPTGMRIGANRGSLGASALAMGTGMMPHYEDGA